MMLTRKCRQLGAFIGRLLALRDFHRVAMVFGKMLLGIVIGLMGIVALLMLIPLTKGVH